MPLESVDKSAYTVFCLGKLELGMQILCFVNILFSKPSLFATPYYVYMCIPARNVQLSYKLIFAKFADTVFCLWGADMCEKHIETEHMREKHIQTLNKHAKTHKSTAHEKKIYTES